MHTRPVPTGTTTLLVRTLRGIEAIAAAEIRERLGVALDLLERIPVRVSGALVEILVLRRRLELAAH